VVNYLGEMDDEDQKILDVLDHKIAVYENAVLTKETKISSRSNLNSSVYRR